MSMVPERIEREVLIDASLDVVWSVVSEPQHVGGWLSDSAEIDLRPGGEAVFNWNAHGAAHGRVERVEPPHFVSFRWMSPAREQGSGGELGEGNSTLVEFTLSAEGEGTRLRVVERGFQQLDGSVAENERYAESHQRGWELELGELRDYVSQQELG
jgi:uncharacterized protein YndB with AHSA1/START domain